MFYIIEGDSMKRKNLQQTVMIIIFVLIGGFCGIVSNIYGTFLRESGETTTIIFIFDILVYIGLAVSFFIHVIIHEAGHCFFGLMTGYQFSSFRIFNFMLLKENGKLKLKRLSIPGTGGQCLMSPPDFDDGKFPFILYNLGGSIFNLIFAIIFLILCLLFRDMPFVSMQFLILSLIGLGLAITNGIPMRGMVDNDGYNAISLKKNHSALWSFWVQMKIAEFNSNGIRLKDMPKEWFVMPTDFEMHNNMSAARAVFICNRLMDEHRFEEAQKLISKLLNTDNAIAPIYRQLLICDQVFCKIMAGDAKDTIDILLDKNQKAFMKSMKNNPTILRTEYVYALLVEQDESRAANIKKRFYEIASSYPYSCEIEGESELIKIAELNK